MKPIIAIDPGKSGGIVYSDSHGRSECHKMPETEGDVLDLLQELAAREPDAVFYLERVAGMIGGKGTGPAMFNFGMGFGFIKGVVMGLARPLVLVLPQKWQKSYNFGTKGSQSDTEWKNKLKAEAQRLFPEHKVTLCFSDALLILHYARQQERG